MSQYKPVMEPQPKTESECWAIGWVQGRFALGTKSLDPTDYPHPVSFTRGLVEGKRDRQLDSRAVWLTGE